MAIQDDIVPTIMMRIRSFTEVWWCKAALTFVVLCACVVTFVVGCSNSTTSRDSDAGEQTCMEPSNPYDEGTGHYAGYNWAEENGGDCEGNSDSFNEGCEEYYSQRDEYQTCLDNQK